MSAHMVYIPEELEGTGVEFRWSGGAYIESGTVDESGEFHAYNVRNVYDYAKGAPEIPFTPEAMQAEVDEWLAEDEDA